MKHNLPKSSYLILLSAIFILAGKVSLAQVESKDFKDITNKWRDIIDTLTTNKLVVGKNYLSILPVVGYAPANGFLAGGAISFSRLFGEPPTNLSTGMLNFQITTKGQFIVNARSKIYLPGNNWFLQGDWRLLLFTQPTYGLGINNSEFNKTHIYTNNLDLVGDDTLAEPMKFKLVRFYEEGTRRLGNSHVYAGLGIMVDQHFAISDERLDTLSGSPDYFITNHYAYSLKNGFKRLKSIV